MSAMFRTTLAAAASSIAAALQVVDLDMANTARANLFVSDQTSGPATLTTITTVAGSGIPGNDDPVTGADPLSHRFSYPTSGAFDERNGHYYVTDTGSNQIKRLNVDIVGNVVGIDTVLRSVTTFPSRVDKGKQVSLALRNPGAILVEPDGGYIFSDEGNHRVIRHQPSPFSDETCTSMAPSACFAHPMCTYDHVQRACLSVHFFVPSFSFCLKVWAKY